jgi:hypothetical protein
MANTLIRNFRKPADRQKAKMTTDEMLGIQIANDANTANARKQIKLGIMPSLLPDEVKSLAEEEQDRTKLEQDARRHLQEIGFRPEDVAEILTAIATFEADPALLIKFNMNAPAIKKDMKDRFNPKLISPAFFMDYLVQYVRQLDATRGLLPVNQGINRFNAVIDTAEELRDVAITRGQIEEIIGRVGNEFRGNPVLRDVMDNLEELRRNLPDTRIINRLNALLKEDRVEGVASLQELANAIRDLPTREQLEQLIRTGSTEKILQALDGVSDKMLDKLEEINSNLGVDVKEGYIPQSEDEIPEAEVSYPSASQDSSMGQPDMITAVLPNGNSKPFLVGLVPSLDPKKRAIVFLNDDGSMLLNDDGRPLIMSRKVQEDIYLRTTFPANFAKYGEDVRNYFAERDLQPRPKGDRTRNYLTWDLVKSATTLAKAMDLILENQSVGKTSPPPPTKEGKGFRGKRRVGRGIELVEQPRYVEFGKYCIHLGQLEKDDLLNVKYLKTNATIPKFPPTPISETFKDFLQNLISNGNPNLKLYNKISPEERKLFQDISTGAGIFQQLNLPKTILDTDKAEEKRFEILRGEWVAGNNSPLIMKELRKMIMKFMEVGKINRRTGKNLLIDIA